jgi:hypothetical protein
MLAQYRAVEAYIVAIIAVTPTASLQELQRSQIEHLKMSIIRSPVEDSTAATPLLQALALPSAAFTVDQQQELCLFIASRNAGQSSVAQGKRAALQVCLNFPHFLTDPQWDRLIALVPVDDQISFLVDIMLNIGLRNPKDGTKVAVVALQVALREEDIPAVEFYRRIRKLTTLLDAKRVSLYARKTQTCVLFPEHAADFALLYPECYTTHPPSMPRISLEKFEDLRAIHGSRSSQRALRDVPGSASTSVPVVQGASTINDILQAIGLHMARGATVPINYMQRQGEPSNLRATQSGGPFHGHAALPDGYMSPLRHSDSSPSLGAFNMNLGSPLQILDRNNTFASSPAINSPALATNVVADTLNGLDDELDAALETRKVAKAKAKAKEATAKAKADAKGKKGGGKGKAKAKAAPKGKAKAAPKGKAKASPKGKAKAKAKANGRPGPLILGCSKCRYVEIGCGTCRRPEFSGNRGHP